MVRVRDRQAARAAGKVITMAWFDGWGSGDSNDSGYWAGGSDRTHRSKSLKVKALKAKAEKEKDPAHASWLWGRADRAASKRGRR